MRSMKLKNMLSKKTTHAGLVMRARLRHLPLPSDQFIGCLLSAPVRLPRMFSAVGDYTLTVLAVVDVVATRWSVTLIDPSLTSCFM